MSRGHTFIVINQELKTPNGSHAQNVMVDVVARMKLKRSSRYPSWLLTGSVEDIYTRRASVAGGTAAQNAGRPGKTYEGLMVRNQTPHNNNDNDLLFYPRSRQRDNFSSPRQRRF